MNDYPALTGTPENVRLAETDRANILAAIEEQITSTAGTVPTDALAELLGIYREVALRHTDAGWWMSNTGRALGQIIQREFTDADKARLTALREQFRH